MRMSDKYFLCLSLLLALIRNPGTSGDLSKKPPNAVASLNSTSEISGTSPGNTTEDKAHGIFNKKNALIVQKHVSKSRSAGGSARPRRRCARTMETCSVHLPCCGRCALCHCRLFNTVCQCWKIGVCPKKN